jgi:hypothetical protein
MSWWRNMEKISWTDRLRNEELLQRVSKGEECPTNNKKKEGNWIGRELCMNNLPKHVTEGNVEGRLEMTGRRGRRHKKLLDDLTEESGYCKLKEDPLDRTMWRSRFGRGYGSLVKQTT